MDFEYGSEQQLMQVLVEKLNTDFNARLDKLISEGRESVKAAIPELFDKKELVDSITSFGLLKERELSVIAAKKHPLDFLYNKWSSSYTLRFEGADIAIMEIANKEVQRLQKNKTNIER